MAQVSRSNVLGELASGLAHELNQPLGAMHCYAETALARTREPDAATNLTEVTDLLEKIVAQSERAGQIIRKLRKLVRTPTVTKSQVNLGEVIHQVTEIIEPDLRRHGIELKAKIDTDVPCVKADAIQLSQVLLNLAKNAIQAMAVSSSDTKKLTIHCKALARHVRISVSDTGPGMDEARLNNVFEPFVTNTGEGRLGMGLMISRSIVEAHGGKLRAKSRPGQGTTIQVTLPH